MMLVKFSSKQITSYLLIPFRFTNGLIYYGLTLSAANLTSSLYLGIVLSGAIEIPANILCIFMMDFKWYDFLFAYVSSRNDCSCSAQNVGRYT